MPRSVTVRVPASTANLGPGFDCLGLALSLFNTVTLAEEEQTTVEIRGEGAGALPADESHLVLRAAAALAEQAGRHVGGWRLVQHNEIPLARGLGSSSAAIVGGLVAADQVLGTGLSGQELLELATGLEGHPDNVAPALFGGLTVCAQEESRTHCLALPAPAGLQVAVAIPDFEVSTQAARAVMPGSYSRAETVYNIAHAALTLAALVAGEYALLGEAMRDRIHQPYRMALVPGMAQVAQAAVEAGAYAAALSGSGPTIAAFCGEERAEVGAAMVEAFAAEGVRAEVRWLAPAGGALAAAQG